jgi:acid phosphatase
MTLRGASRLPPKASNHSAAAARQARSIRPSSGRVASCTRSQCSNSGSLTTFAGYSEDLPSVGSTACSSGAYARKHVPWTNFSNVPSSDNLPWSSFPTPANYAALPTVSWVIPNLNNDMHDGSVAQGDAWLRNHMDAYAQWAKTHSSLLIVTGDEDDSSGNNQIATILYGAGVTPGHHSEHITHFSVLRTIEDMYGLPHAGSAASAAPITDIWSAPAGP